MPQLKTQKDNLTESEKERFQNAYISELKKIVSGSSAKGRSHFKCPQHLS